MSRLVWRGIVNLDTAGKRNILVRLVQNGDGFYMAEKERVDALGDQSWAEADTDVGREAQRLALNFYVSKFGVVPA